MRARARIVVPLLCAACSGGGAAAAFIGADAGVVDGSIGDAGGAHDSDAVDDATPGETMDAAASYRDPRLQPFASTSIWNMPIGSAAEYVPANIARATGNTLYGDEDVVVLTPTSPSTAIYRNGADWQPTVSRCPWDAGALLYDIPLPADFVVGDTPTSSTPNSSLAALLADGRTLKQTQPFARCTAGAPATSDYEAPDVDLYGAGIVGAHGGSGLSAIGGTLRLGELRPNGAPPRHALKLELFAAKNYYNDGVQADCYRWPAVTCDGYFDDSTSALRYGGTNASLRPGSLVAIPTTVSIASLGLTTVPAQMLAFTLQNYGAYLVDDSAWSSTSICIENGPAGSFASQFSADWGFPIDTNGTTGAFATDMAAIVAALEVVENNGAASIGGGGTPLQPLAPALVDPTDGGD